MSLAKSAFIAALGLTALAGTAAGASAQSYAPAHQTVGCQTQAQYQHAQNHKGKFKEKIARLREEMREGKISREQAHAEIRQLRMEHRQMREARLERMQGQYGQGPYGQPGSQGYGPQYGNYPQNAPYGGGAANAPYQQNNGYGPR